MSKQEGPKQKEFNLDEIDGKWKKKLGSLVKKDKELTREKKRINNEAEKVWLDFQEEFELDDYSISYDHEENKIIATKIEHNQQQQQRPPQPQPQGSPMPKINRRKKKKGLLGWLGLS